MLACLFKCDIHKSKDLGLAVKYQTKILTIVRVKPTTHSLIILCSIVEFILES